MQELPYRPTRGEVLICDFDAGGFSAPEMVKVRPVVVLSPKDSHGRKLCTVVPLSTTVPIAVQAWHCRIERLSVPGFDVADRWAKCDMVCTVSFKRLWQPYIRTRGGRIFRPTHVSPAHLAAIDQCLRAYLKL